MRTIAELRATGAAWITESELAWLCEQLEAAQKMEQQLHEEIDELAISLMDESDVVVSQANGYRDVLHVVAERIKELQEQLEALGAEQEHTERRLRAMCSGYEAQQEQSETTRTALEALLDHAERIQEHVPKSENWYAVRDCARVALSKASSPASEPRP